MIKVKIKSLVIMLLVVFPVSAFAVTFVKQDGYIDGFELTYVSVSNITVSVGVCKDSTGAENLLLTNSITLTLPDDLDIGAEIDHTWYAVYIAKTNGAYECTYSTNSITPVGYDLFRRIGWVRNNGSTNLLKFRQSGKGKDRAYWYDEQKSVIRVLGSGNATNYTVIALKDFVPPTSRKATLEIEYKTGTAPAASANNYARIKAKGADWALARISNGHKSEDFTYYRVDILTDYNQEIEYKVEKSNNRLGVMVLKWDDEL